MKKFVLVVFTVFLFTTADFAQKNDPNVTQIIWAKETKCSDSNLPTVRNGIIQCSKMRDGLVYKIIDYGNIYCAFAYSSFLDGEVLAATFKVINRSGKPVFIDVEKSYSAKYANENSFKQKEKSKDFKLALDPGKTADKVQLRLTQVGGSSSEIPGIRPGLSAQSRIGVEEGRRGMTVIEPRTRNQRTQTEKVNTVITANPTSRLSKKAILESALTSKTLADKDNATGKIFFKGYKDDNYRIVVLRIDNLEFVFPLN